MTRFYLPSSGAAAVSPAASAEWEDTTINAYLKAVTTKISSAMTTVSFTDASVANRDILFRTYVSDPLAAQVIEAGVDVAHLVMRGSQNDVDNNMFLTFKVKLVSNDGSIVRGTVAAIDRDSTELVLDTLTGRDNTADVSEITCYSGDRLVIEVGTAGNPADSGSLGHDSSLSIGDDSATDLSGDGDTDADNPWIEFTQTLNFFTAGDIIVHNHAIPGDGDTNDISVSFTVSSLSNRLLVAFLQIYEPVNTANRAITSITYAGDSMTSGFSETSAGNTEDRRIYYKYAPTSGSNTFAVNIAGAVTLFNCIIVELANCLQSGQFDVTDVDAFLAATTADGVATTVADRVLVLSVGRSDNAGWVPDANSVVIRRDTLDGGYFPVAQRIAIKTPAGEVTTTWTGGIDNGSIYSVGIKPYVAAGTAVKDLIQSGIIPFAR